MLSVNRIIGTGLGALLAAMFILTPVFACQPQADTSENQAPQTVYLALSPTVLAAQVHMEETQAVVATDDTETQVATQDHAVTEAVALQPR